MTVYSQCKSHKSYDILSPEYQDSLIVFIQTDKGQDSPKTPIVVVTEYLLGLRTKLRTLTIQF